ncbi:MAG: stage III sporulation protein AG, partial [Eubacteriales bacterium]|nr:stage III sporulation protein AG [Eubacteriales bacterium]
GEGGTLAGEGATLAGDSGASAVEVSATPAGTYEAVLEKRVREILKHVEGVGTVDVMIVLKSSAEKVIHVDGSSSLASTEEKDSSGGTRRIESQEQENSAVLLAGEGQNAPIIEKELYPEISGIVISATGGGDPKIQAEISAAMEALFDVPAHKIKVLKRVE